MSTTNAYPTIPLPLQTLDKVEPAERLVDKKKRIRKELVKAGMTAYGLRKFNSRYLPNIIRDNEHIHGVVYGRFEEAPGILGWTERMMVATDQRVISLNHKPGYTDSDEFIYDIIDSIDRTTAGPFTAVTVNAIIEHPTLRFVNKKCAERFIDFVENRRLEYYKARWHTK